MNQLRNRRGLTASRSQPNRRPKRSAVRASGQRGVQIGRTQEVHAGWLPLLFSAGIETAIEREHGITRLERNGRAINLIAQQMDEQLDPVRRYPPPVDNVATG